jgi:imidazolonepropionase-like amidohydrolase
MGGRRWRLAGGLVYDVEAGHFEPLDVRIEGEWITDLARPVSPPSGETTIHATGLHLLPGLIDCHVHLVMASEDPDPSANARRPDTAIALHASRAAERTLLAGVTAVRDVGGWNYLEMGLRDAIDRGVQSGPRLFLAGRLLSVPTGGAEYYPGMYEVAEGTEKVRGAVRKQLAHGADLIKVMATGAMLSPESEDAGDIQYSPAELETVVHEAERSGRHVAAHAHAAQGVRNAMEAGVGSIEHGTFADESTLREMAERGTFLVPTLSPSEALLEDREVAGSMPEHQRARLIQTREIHIETMRRAHRAGVPIAMGTDAGTPANQHGRNPQECRLMVEDMGMSPEEAIKASTLNPARLLRREADFGAIWPGRYADIVGCRGNPLDDISELTRLVLVVKGGAVYKGQT